MDIKTLKQMEKEFVTDFKLYVNRDESGKLTEQFEKDANGEWKDVTSIRQSEEHYIDVARKAGIPEQQIQEAVMEARARREHNKFDT